MSFPHHGDELREQMELMKRFQAEREGRARREYPEGRIGAEDEGSLTFKIGVDGDKHLVFVEYSKPTVWVAMSPQQAIEFAQSLIKHARAVSDTPLRIVLS